MLATNMECYQLTSFWCSAVQVGKTQSHSFVVRGVSTFVYSVSAGRKVATYCVSPRNPLTLVAVVDWGQDAMRSVLRGSGFMLDPDIMSLRKHSSVVNSMDFALLQ